MKWHTIEGRTWNGVWRDVRVLLICAARGHIWENDDALNPGLRDCRRCHVIQCEQVHPSRPTPTGR